MLSWLKRATLATKAQLRRLRRAAVRGAKRRTLRSSQHTTSMWISLAIPLQTSLNKSPTRKGPRRQSILECSPTRSPLRHLSCVDRSPSQGAASDSERRASRERESKTTTGWVGVRYGHLQNHPKHMAKIGHIWSVWAKSWLMLAKVDQVSPAWTAHGKEHNRQRIGPGVRNCRPDLADVWPKHGSQSDCRATVVQH